VLVVGPSGSGKSTFFRAIGGIWPFGSGTITMPKGARVMMLPQRPYFPVAPLGAALIYPSEPGAFTAEQIGDALKAVGLPALTERIEEEAHWNRMLSLGEQQRLGLARALLHRPDYLFLDEATASLDEASEAALYRLLHERLKDSTIVSIGHRATLNAFHSRRVEFTRDGERFRVGESAVKPAQ
jgi:putative ATP-binding cassette transporter